MTCHEWHNPASGMAQVRHAHAVPDGRVGPSISPSTAVP